MENIGAGSIISMVSLLPHEFLHAVCFKEDVYLYHDLSKLLLFVHGTESMSKARLYYLSEYLHSLDDRSKRPQSQTGNLKELLAKRYAYDRYAKQQPYQSVYQRKFQAAKEKP